MEFMGGEKEVLKKSQVSFDKGEYRWVAEVMKHAVFANPESTDAKELLADAYEQLGYQSESAHGALYTYKVLMSYVMVFLRLVALKRQQKTLFTQ
jgi:alkyl sulfatase BDS1-like metallo-beta-lactamase superfamily hydrolase